MGVATSNAAGLPASYTVAAGDADIAIEQRFCLTGEELWGVLNRIRFCDPSYTIQPGDVLNLDPITVGAVGSNHARCPSPSGR